MPGGPLGAQELFGCQPAVSSWGRASTQVKWHILKGMHFGDLSSMTRVWSGTSGVLVIVRSSGVELKYMVTQQTCQEVYLFRTSGPDIIFEAFEQIPRVIVSLVMIEGKRQSTWVSTLVAVHKVSRASPVLYLPAPEGDSIELAQLLCSTPVIAQARAT